LTSELRQSANAIRMYSQKPTYMIIASVSLPTSAYREELHKQSRINFGLK